MKKALIIATIPGFIAAFEKNDIKILQEMGFEVHCASNMETDTGNLDDTGAMLHHICFERSPFSKKNIRAFKELNTLMKKEKFDLVHCHTPVGGVLGRLAAMKNRIPHILYTAHGFHFYDGAPLKNWLVFYPVEWLLSFGTDVLITINKMDYYRSKKLNAKRTVKIPGVGINTEKFAMFDQNYDLREELGINKKSVLLFSAGEVIDNKNHQIIIRAMSKYPHRDLHYCIAGKGNLEEELLKLARKFGLEENIHLLGFRDDMPKLLHSADVFCFPSKREGLGLAAIEAMAAGLPLITSDRGGIRDYSVHKKTGCMCRYDNVEQFANAIEFMYQNPELRKKIGKRNQKAVKEFDIANTERIMREVYLAELERD